MRATVAILLVATYRVGYSLKLGKAPLPWGAGSSRGGRCACSRQQVASRSPSKLLRCSEVRGTATSASRLSAASEDADVSTGGLFTQEAEGLRADKGTPVGSIEGDSAEDAVTPELLDSSDFLQPDVAFEQEEEEEEEENWHTPDANGFFDDEGNSDVQGYGSANPAAASPAAAAAAITTTAIAVDDDDCSGDDESDGGDRPVEKVARKSGPGGAAKGKGGGGGGGAGSLEGLSADEVERRLIAAGILRGDGAEIDFDEDDDGEAGVYNEIEVSDGEEACRILEERLGFDEEGIGYLRSKYPPLRGELWYRREPASGGSKTGKKFLDVYFVEETLPDLLDLLLGEEGEGGGIGLDRKQARGPADSSHSEQFWGDVDADVSYYREALAWTSEDVAAMLAEYPNLLSIKMENDVIEVIDYLRTEVGLQSFTVSGMVREFPQVLEVRPKRLKAVVRKKGTELELQAFESKEVLGTLSSVLEIPRSGIAVLLSQHPRACCLEAEANLAPLRQFFERELFVEDTSRIGHLVYKFPRLLFQDVDTQLVPRAEEFRKAMGLEGLEPLPPRVRLRPKRSKFSGAGRARGANSGFREGRGAGRWPSGRGRGGGGRPNDGRGVGGRGGGEYRGRGEEYME
ncbi:unnamed protein product [Ectocarpus sp. CCAP 1310/34]|nr:unnamed protein product [Ectocarpus sp. CCAP 1310/34]